MDIAGSTALVTGANRGMGAHFARQLIERGATVYATARRPETIDVPGAEVLRLDVTDPASIAAAAQVATGVNLVVNNAGSSTYASLLAGDPDDIRLEMETHYFGPLAVVRAFAPSLVAAGGGAVLNVCSNLSWRSYAGVGAYSAAKAAEWMLTNGLRLELAQHGTLVTALHVAAVDTDMMAGWDVPKSDPAYVVRAALDGVAADALEVVADEATAASKAGLAGPVEAMYAEELSRPVGA